ncbi:MAG: 3-isopropylmalate dehydratase small subunit [Clostridia bacterium]|nr:3-isopropylmalate dehydratase small subunit [Clostridia bacterium]
MRFRGRARKFGDHIDTDAILPGRYLTDWNRDPKSLGRHCFADFDPGFSSRVNPGDILVAGWNFGCGSSRQAAAAALKAAGISCLVAKSFARIFFRNAINIGLPAVECPDLVEEATEGDLLEVAVDEGLLVNVSTGHRYSAGAFPPVVLEILRQGGLVSYVRARLQAAER